MLAIPSGKYQIHPYPLRYPRSDVVRTPALQQIVSVEDRGRFVNSLQKLLVTEDIYTALTIEQNPSIGDATPAIR